MASDVDDLLPFCNCRTEAKYIALSTAAIDAILLSKIVKGLGLSSIEPIIVNCNNMLCV